MDTPDRSTATVLVADDDALVRGVLRTALTRAGYRVIEAQDAIEVITVSAADGPDLVVLDINMPGGDVRETLEFLRARARDLPVLVLSGDAAPPADIVNLTTDFASKPIDLGDLLARVRLLLDVAGENQ